METSDNIDIYHKWYNKNMIASAGSSVMTEAGSKIVLDYAIDLSHGEPHLNQRVRVGQENGKLKGEDVFKDLHFIDLEIEG